MLDGKTKANVETKVETKVMVIVGGTKDKAEYYNVLEATVVDAKQVENAVKVFGWLCYNFLAGNVHKSITDEFVQTLPRECRNEAMAIRKLLKTPTEQIRYAWSSYCETKERYSEPSLQILYRALTNLEKGNAAKNLSLRDKIKLVINNSKLTADMKVSEIRKLVA